MEYWEWWLLVDEVQPECVGSPPDRWFSRDRADIAWCKRVCAHCPLQESCRAGALERGEEYGVWGGELMITKIARRDRALKARRLAAAQAAVEEAASEEAACEQPAADITAAGERVAA